MSSWRCHLVFAVTSFVLFGLSQPSNAQNVNVTTWHNAPVAANQHHVPRKNKEHVTPTGLLMEGDYTF